MASAAPLIVTAGEPAGVGPELCLKLAMHRTGTPFAVVADPRQLEALASRLGYSVRVTEVSLDPKDWPERKADELYTVPLRYPVGVLPGAPNPANSHTQLEGLDVAARAVMDGHYAALVTAPLQKSAIIDAGVEFSGHTEYLAGLCAAPLPVMLLVAGSLRVALATTHLPLRDVADAINQDGLESVIRVLDEGLKERFGITAPRIAVCGLNPHAGEGGHLGHEDRDVIQPVIEKLAAAGLSVTGPVPADTAFRPDDDSVDATLAMYHDQGLPVLKYASFGHAVNVTLGLSFVRTSVDHGTALDIAGQGLADAGSLLAAFDLALELGAR